MEWEQKNANLEERIESIVVHSEEDREIVVFFLDFQATKEVPKKIQYPETERLVVAQVAQSKSKKCLNFKRGVGLIQKAISKSMF